jgi:hypothetical protein
VVAILSVPACSTTATEDHRDVVRQSATVVPTLVVGVANCPAGISEATVVGSPFGSGIFDSSPTRPIPLGGGARATLTAHGLGTGTPDPLIADFSSTVPVAAVVLSGVEFNDVVVSNVYNYAPAGVTSDTLLTAPQSIFVNTTLDPYQVTLCFAGVVCTPTTCAAQHTSCGSIPDLCGGMLDCGTCGTTLFADTFDRDIPPDEGLGASWSTAVGAWFTDGRAQSDRDSGNLATERVAVCADCTVQASLLGFGVRETGLTLRSPSVSSTDRYDVILQGSGNLQIRRVRGGVITVLGQAPSGLTVLNDLPDTVSLSASGAGPVHLVASVDGVARITVNDASAAALTGAGYAGLWTSHAGVVFDDFSLTSH